MNGDRMEPSARFRPLKAIAIVMALLLAVPGIEAVMHVADAAPMRGSATAGFDSSAVFRSTDAFAALDKIEDAIDDRPSAVPEAFAEEVGLLPDARDVRVSDDGSVVGYLVEGEASDVLANLEVHMESAGWTAVPLGEVDGMTFVKSGGKCTWALVTCTQVGASASVVVRSMQT